jgi:hypothetical protein
MDLHPFHVVLVERYAEDPITPDVDGPQTPWNRDVCHYPASPIHHDPLTPSPAPPGPVAIRRRDILLGPETPLVVGQEGRDGWYGVPTHGATNVLESLHPGVVEG